ncbi:MmcQ/YjbR family DNA-binding protein [Pedobacter glucosidilyticus]|uniref:MmcQ/YjbR family DNA-binding protein n=1 Tax=Pedobacter glucosidilyticus TaxID=1122941 RepID=UPI0003F9E3C7|nr:MmcQ/YjbR family DNA-binding protein [Pedobacter glucosidilyticus]
MNIESLRNYCLHKKGVTESFPFGDDTLVFKIADKIFLLAGLTAPISFNVKCEPEKAIQLRESFTEVVPGYHMNKKHWNTVYYNGSLSDKQLTEMIDHSYELVLKSLPKKQQEEIYNL